MGTLTQDWQIDFAGVVIGPGTQIPIANVEGLGAPEPRTQDVDNATDDGAFPGVDYYSPRTLRIEAGIRTPGDPGAALDILAKLQATADTPQVRKTAGALAQLRLAWPGRGVKALFGRVRRVDAITVEDALHGWIPLDLEFLALDPRFHDDTVSQVVLPLDISNDTHGFTSPLLAPITTGVVDPSERPGWAYNAGDMAAWPQITFTGPVTNPKVWVVETGRAIELAVTLGVGERIDIDTRPGSRWVLKNGSGNASPSLTSASRLDQFQLPPGRSEVRWTATDYTNSARLNVSWRSAYTSL